MVIDSSAIVALLFNEPEADRIEIAIERDPVRFVSAATWSEAAIVVESHFREGGAEVFDALIRRTGMEIVSVEIDQSETARMAYRRWGKGHHPASLNFGDCFAYALSKVSGEPLLFKGDDFGQTDVDRVDY
ncbi:MAG: type II toxin-antitoxin system VapC family toxin [Gemmatimonadetes bacterium]|nr:type II toxin-antitoxin system VapC family toxin [Gemmatimonadota bacterium]